MWSVRREELKTVRGFKFELFLAKVVDGARKHPALRYL
jgi:hypothetical protein